MLAPLAAFETRRAAARFDAQAWRLAIVISLTLFVGSALQQIALATTTVTNGGFLTACYVVLTPIAVWLLTGRLPRSIVAVACLLSTAGAWLLANGGGPAQPMSVGDGLILLSDVAWALGIALTPMFLARQPRPFTLAFLEYAICGALAAGAAAAFEPVRAADFVAGLVPLLYCRNHLRRRRLHHADRRPSLHAAGGGGADPVARKRVRRDRRVDPACRAADGGGDGGLRL